MGKLYTDHATLDPRVKKQKIVDKKNFSAIVREHGWRRVSFTIHDYGQGWPSE